MRARVVWHDPIATTAIFVSTEIEDVSTHWHEQTEILQVIRGELQERSNGLLYRSGSSCLIPPRVPHCPVLFPGTILSVTWEPGLPEWDPEAHEPPSPK